MDAIEAFKVPAEILKKYAKPGPRYTSYPTAPEWDQNFQISSAEGIYQANNEVPNAHPLALYFHIPYCQSLCYYCGCNMKVSRNRAVVAPYLQALKQEMALVSSRVQKGRQVTQMHWGGGTPTYLSPDEILSLVKQIKTHFEFSKDAEISIEVDPRVTTPEHVKALRKAGFNRMSMGIQDFNLKVQEAVNRVQSFEDTFELIQNARNSGFNSINIDLMYGLPHQSVDSFQTTLEQVKQLNPDRVALFHYAHVPWHKPQQKLIKEDELPDSATKLAIFELAIEFFLKEGYQYIGMDHFARPDDELSEAQSAHTLRRNFMGYTTQAGIDLYGFGVSSISEIDGHFIQNQRDITAYQHVLKEGQLPALKGMNLSQEDHLRKAVIESLICNCYLDFKAIGDAFKVDFKAHFAQELEATKAFIEDGLLVMNDDHIQVLPRGQMLIRNICMVWDAYLAESTQKFSQTA